MSTAKRLTKLAQDCRTLARSADTSGDRRELLAIADRYEREARDHARKRGMAD